MSYHNCSGAQFWATSQLGAGTHTIPATDLQLLQGTLDVLVLKTLTAAPRHGYAIARWIRDPTDDELIVEDRALYVSLHRMEQRGWLMSAWGVTENNRRAKYYALTPSGRQQLSTQAVRWERYAAAVSKIVASA